MADLGLIAYPLLCNLGEIGLQNRRNYSAISPNLLGKTACFGFASDSFRRPNRPLLPDYR